MSERPTLGAVAQRAGVSLKTASRALNGEYGVAPATAAKVKEAAKALGFRPNQLARALAAGGPSKVVGLVIPSVSDPFLAAMVGAVEEVLAPRGLTLMTASHHDDADLQQRIIRSLVERRVDALLVVPAPGDAGYLAHEVDHGLVVIAIDRPLDGVEVDTVVVDNVAGAGAAVAELVSLGHRRIGGLGTDDRLWTLQQRHHGYRTALQDHGIGYDVALTNFDCHTDRDAERFTLDLLESADPPTAFVSVQHVTSRGLMRAVGRVDRPVAVAMFDEVIDTDLLSVKPHIVAASGPHRLGHIGATLMVERLDSTPDAEAPPRRVVLPPIMIGRGQAYSPQSLAESLDDLAGAAVGAGR